MLKTDRKVAGLTSGTFIISKHSDHKWRAHRLSTRPISPHKGANVTSLFFDDFQIGDKFKTAGRTICEADIVTFAGLSGDYHQLHTNEEYAKETPFGHRVAHGILTQAITSGLISRLGIYTETGMANLGSSEKYMLPVFPGDTIHAEIEITGKKPMENHRGMISSKIATVNQNGETVMIQEMNVMVRCTG